MLFYASYSGYFACKPMRGKLSCIGQAFCFLEIRRGREIGCPCGLMTVFWKRGGEENERV